MRCLQSQYRAGRVSAQSVFVIKTKMSVFFSQYLGELFFFKVDAVVVRNLILFPTHSKPSQKCDSSSLLRKMSTSLGVGVDSEAPVVATDELNNAQKRLVDMRAHFSDARHIHNEPHELARPEPVLSPSDGGISKDSTSELSSSSSSSSLPPAADQTSDEPVPTTTNTANQYAGKYGPVKMEELRHKYKQKPTDLYRFFQRHPFLWLASASGTGKKRAMAEYLRTLVSKQVNESGNSPAATSAFVEDQSLVDPAKTTSNKELRVLWITPVTADYERMEEFLFENTGLQFDPFLGADTLFDQDEPTNNSSVKIEKANKNKNKKEAASAADAKRQLHHNLRGIKSRRIRQGLQAKLQQALFNVASSSVSEGASSNSACQTSSTANTKEETNVETAVIPVPQAVADIAMESLLTSNHVLISVEQLPQYVSAWTKKAAREADADAALAVVDAPPVTPSPDASDVATSVVTVSSTTSSDKKNMPQPWHVPPFDVVIMDEIEDILLGGRDIAASLKLSAQQLQEMFQNLARDAKRVWCADANSDLQSSQTRFVLSFVQALIPDRACFLLHNTFQPKLPQIYFCHSVSEWHNQMRLSIMEQTDKMIKAATVELDKAKKRLDAFETAVKAGTDIRQPTIDDDEEKKESDIVDPATKAMEQAELATQYRTLVTATKKELTRLRRLIAATSEVTPEGLRHKIVVLSNDNKGLESLGSLSWRGKSLSRFVAVHNPQHDGKGEFGNSFHACFAYVSKMGQIHTFVKHIKRLLRTSDVLVPTVFVCAGER